MDLQGLTLHHLRVFQRVAHTLSFTRTAEELHLSQPVVSRTIRIIERKTGVELFSRTSRTVEITPAGFELLSIVDQTLATHGAGLARFERYLSGGVGTISVVALPSLAATVVPVVVERFTRSRPDIVVDVSDGLADEIVESVIVGRSDVGMTARSAHTRGLVQTPWISDEMHALVPADHPLASRPSVSWSDISVHPFIGFPEGSSVHGLTSAGFAHAGVAPRPAHVVRSPLAVHGMVAGGMGVSALPGYLAELAPGGATLAIPLQNPGISRQIVVVTSPNVPRSPAADHFVDHLLNCADDLKA